MTELRCLSDLVPDGPITVPRVFAARVHRSPDTVFLIEGERRWTYAEAAREISATATLLQRACRGKDRPRIASFLGNSHLAMWTWLAAMELGATYLPINRQHRGDVLADMLRRARADTLAVEASAVERLPPLSAIDIDSVVMTDVPASAAPSGAKVVMSFEEQQASPSLAHPHIKPSDIAAVLYTSGTTGRSKGVQVPHYQFCRGAARLVEAWGLREGDVFHNWLPLYHLAGTLHMTMSAVIAGGTVALFPTFSRTRFWDEVRSTGATVICGFTTILHWLLAEPEKPSDADNTLRVGIIAGIPADVHRQFENRFGLLVHDQYGMTEADPMTVPDPSRQTPPGSSGPASPDFEIAILDDEDNRLPAGKVGQIAMRPRVANVMMMGYEGDEAATIAAWRNLWFHTGDLGSMDADGFLTFKGRGKDAIRRRGENISTLEIEQAVLLSPDVAECAALGVPSAIGEEDVKIVVVLRPGLSITPQQIHDHCRGRMARFMVPRYIEVVAALPKSNLGKVQKDQLKAIDGATWDAERP